MKTLIIGGSHGGIQTALTLKKIKSDETIIIYEKGDFISFIASGINMYLKGVVPDLSGAQLFKEKEVEQAGVQLKKNHEVLSIDIPGYQVLVKNLNTGDSHWEKYDRLVLAMGSAQSSIPLLSNTKECVKTYKSYTESLAVLEEIKKAETITIIGAGYIGVELANTLFLLNKQIQLIESGETILNRYYEKEIIQSFEKQIQNKQIQLLLNDTVLDVQQLGKGKKLVKTTTKELLSDLVIYAINGRPNTQLIRGQIATLPDHTIKVDAHMQTSAKDVYAVGDLVAYPVTNVKGMMYTPLVNETIRTANVAAMNLGGYSIKYQANQRTTLTNIFGKYTASTGMTLRQAAFEGREVKHTRFKHKCKNGTKEEMTELLLVFQEDDGLLLGAQLISTDNVISAIDYLSLAINRRTTAEELATMDCSFHPELNLPYHYINEAALAYLMSKRVR